MLQEVVEQILETLRLCIEELDVMHQSLLDTVLIQLLPVMRTENLTSYQLATVRVYCVQIRVFASSCFKHESLAGFSTFTNCRLQFPPSYPR